MEAEFGLVLDDVPAKPEDIFGDPRAFLRGELMHRVGTSYHLPTGGAVYFDSGVIEVATPVIEIEKGGAARAGRSLWEAILEVRNALDDWERASSTTRGWWASARSTTSPSNSRATCRERAEPSASSRSC
jgi:hypothetical protein